MSHHMEFTKNEWNITRFTWPSLHGTRIIPGVTTGLEVIMMTSSNGKIFRVTGPLCGEFTGPGEFPAQRPVMRSFDVFFDLSLNKRLSKQPWGWWFETPVWSLWRHRNDLHYVTPYYHHTLRKSGDRTWIPCNCGHHIRTTPICNSWYR